MIEYRFMERKAYGSQCWLKESSKGGDGEMDRKAELKQLYKDEETQAGVYQIRNMANQKVLVLSTMNLRTMNGKKFGLKMGNFMNKELQKEWNKFGEEAFAFELLEVLEMKKDEYFNAKEALEKLEEKWLNKLKPYGERGYNRNEERR